MSFSRSVSYFTLLSPGACPRVSLLNRSSRSIATWSPSLSETMDSGWKRRGTARHVRWVVLGSDGGGEAKLLLAQVPVVVLVVLLPLFVRVLVMPAGPVYPKLERLTCGHLPPLK